jgi:hypothetical protein
MRGWAWRLASSPVEIRDVSEGLPMPLTAFPSTEGLLREQLTGAGIHVESFHRPLRGCDLAECKGMCCHDGVYLEADEAEVVASVARQEATFFHSLGLGVPTPAVVEGNWRDLIVGPKTATVPRAFSRRVPGYPSHFNDTACCFLTEDGRCGLQVLSAARGHHRWHFKPTGCWLHPIRTDHSPSHPLGLCDERTDPFHFDDYPGFVSRSFCGRTPADGPPAYETLREELLFLGSILGRDLLAEIVPAEESGKKSLDVLQP